MGQIAEARAVLQIVLNKGNAEQQTQAAQLLSRLNS
jgi:FimV-like protein